MYVCVFCIVPGTYVDYSYSHTHAIRDSLPIKPAGSGDRRREQNRRTARGDQRPDRDPQNDEPFQFLRSPGGRRHGRGAIHPGPARLARTTCHPVCRSEEHTSELQSLMSISYAAFCLTKNTSTKPSLTSQ